MNNKQELKGKTAIVTGSSRGIGAAIARELSAYGANVVINYKLHHEDAAKMRDEVESFGGKAEVIQADVSDIEQVRHMISKTLLKFQHIDILVNNAGITSDRTVRKMAIEDWNHVLQVNLNGVFNCTSLAVPHLLKQKKGHIINIASVIAMTGNIGQGNYAAAKAGILGFTKSCALELARSGITVNAICPGFIATAMLDAIPNDKKENILTRIPMGRFGAVEEIANCVRFLVVEGSYITGQSIHINGGLFM